MYTSIQTNGAPEDPTRNLAPKRNRDEAASSINRMQSVMQCRQVLKIKIKIKIRETAVVPRVGRNNLKLFYVSRNHGEKGASNEGYVDYVNCFADQLLVRPRWEAMRCSRKAKRTHTRARGEG